MAKYIIVLFITFSVIAGSFGEEQAISIEIDKDTLALNEMFSISVYFPVGKNKEISYFPEIYGFSKRRTTYSREGNFYKVTQYYQPGKAGVFALEPFRLMVSGRSVSFEGKLIKVLPSSGAEFLFEEPNESSFEDVNEDVFFEIKCSKQEVFVGENFEIVAAFFISRENKVEMNFVDIQEQVQHVINSIKLPGLWLENYVLTDQLPVDSVTVNNKVYFRYTIFRQNVNVLTEASLVFPSLSWKMNKYKLARNRNFIDREDNIVHYKSRPQKVSVKELPPHPLKDKLPLGNFQMHDVLSPSEASDGEKVKFSVSISGNELISGLFLPIIRNQNKLDFYSIGSNASIEEELKSRTYNYYIIGRKPGTYALKDYVSFIFFNLEEGRYDTLSPASVMTFSGSEPDAWAQPMEEEYDFYMKLEKESRKFVDTSSEEKFKLFGNIFIILLLIATLILIFKK